MGLRDFTLWDVILRNAQLHGNSTAFICQGQRITHGEYARRARRLASGLSRAGVGAGDRVAMLAHNCMEYVDLYGAVARLGAILVPLNWRLGQQEIAHALANTTPRLIIVGAEQVPIIESTRADFQFPHCCYALGSAQQGFLSFDELMAPGEVTEADAAVVNDTGFVIMHTAGVDGRARGALLTHGGLLAANLQLGGHWRLGPQDVHLGVLPLFHAIGLGLMLAVQQAGGATLLLPRFDAQQVLQMVRAERVTVFAEFPPMLASLLDQAGEEGAQVGAQAGALASLRHITGIDTAATITRFEATCPAATFWSVYGQTEVSGPVCLSPYRDRPGSAGQPALPNQVRIVDERDQPVATGKIGEIVVRGPMVFAGYWNCEADNQVTFRNAWHHTGDLGRLDEDGYLWYAGRSPAKELIKPGGENVYPAEVEQALLEHPAVAQAVVFGVPDDQWGEAIKAVCVRKDGQALAADELIEFVASRIARFKKPRYLVFAAALPRTEAGLLDRARIKQEFGRNA